ncbi:rhodanese-like domain-containing protein [Paenibacillus kobensis]|uniref:rhodanese-like domain-containing protein n=1 Tax=Paenibacillus kobensis TaxID=59841 RepID=UPI000FD779E9|nr:rhodanese-like domain-containing protein [Paenibacillus kobensis]
MIFVYILASAVVLRVLYGLLPVPSLRYIQGKEEGETANNDLNVKMLDVRDASDYWKRNIPGSINISLGRLPYVWRKQLSIDDVVVILSPSRSHSRKAARILRRRGFRRLYATRCGICSPWMK